MTQGAVEIALPVSGDRSLPPSALAQMCKAIQSSGVVDHIHIWDQMMGWWPPHLWNQENSPLAAVVPDLDSFGDPAALAGFAAASAPGMGLTISTDAIRQGPAEMMRTMLTMANMGEGRAILQIGAGEIKQTAPFGWKRSEGWKRLEDHLRFYQAYWKSGGQVDMTGHFWNFEKAWIGSARQHRPRVWALGGGPKMIDLATSYADGFATMVPNVLSTPERFSEFVRSTRRMLSDKGRDPMAFDFAPWVYTLISDDPDVIDRAFDNPIIKWAVAIFGRLNNADWAPYGIEPAFPADWHYAMKLVPNRITDKQYVDSILGRVTRKMFDLAFITGNVREVAAQIQTYVEAGATCIDICDTSPIILDPAGAQAAFGRQLELCARIKGKL